MRMKVVKDKGRQKNSTLLRRTLILLKVHNVFYEHHFESLIVVCNDRDRKESLEAQSIFR